jgi:phosphate transport system substrate-binding protein
MKNHDGDYVSPSLSTVAADAAQKPNVTSTDFAIVDLPGSSSYPISGYSWLLVYKQQKNTNLGTTLVHILDWLTHSGQSQAQAIDYVPLPANIQQLARTTLLGVVGSSGQTLLTTS